QDIALKQGDDFQVVGLSSSGKASAGLVFAGYGATAEQGDYDDYKGLDVAGKIGVVLRKTPRADNHHAGFEGGPAGMHAGLLTKMANAAKHKAAAVLFANDPVTAREGDKLMPFEYTAEETEPSGLPAAHLRRDLADTLLHSGLGTGLKEVEQDIDRELKPH